MVILQDSYNEVFPGVFLQVLESGIKIMMVKYIMLSGSEVPLHSHPEEQIGYVLKGEAVLLCGNSERTYRKGESYCIPPNEKHMSKVIVNSSAEFIDIFSPPREDFIHLLNGN